MSEVREPAKSPCGSCPYRTDVPSGVWAAEEYEKLPPYDNDTQAQPLGLFLCHQQDGRVCAGWAGCHDMHRNLGLRFAASLGHLSDEVLVAVLDYRTEVSLFPSGAAAAEHGMADIDTPGERACRVVAKIERTQERAQH